MTNWTQSLIVALALGAALVAAVDQTLQDKAIGQDVVEVSIQKIHDSGIFTPDYQFLNRIAWVESHYGRDAHTFTLPRQGLWQMRKEEHNATLAQGLSAIHASIKRVFNITWNTTQLDDLNKPLYGALAARMYLHTKPQPLPQTKADQAAYWQRYYTTNDNLNETYFRNETDKLEDEQPPCDGKMDLCVLLDASGSIGEGPFELARQFVIDFLASLSSDPNFVRKALVIYNNNNDIRFNLTNNLTTAEMSENINNYTYVKGGTYTNAAIKVGVDLMTGAPNRTGVPRIMTVFTDGQATDGVSNIVLAQKAEITPFAIGIGQDINERELLTIALQDPSHVYTVQNYDALVEFFRTMNQETCNIPQQPGLNESTSDTLGAKQKRFYRFEVPEGGITIDLSVKIGKTSGYYSYTYMTPNSAFNDGSINGKTYIEYKNTTTRDFQFGVKATDVDSTIYLSVTGEEASNEYVIEATLGDTTGAGLIAAPLATLLLLSVVFNIFK